MSRTNKNLDIEILRAFAVLLVMVDHLQNLITWPSITASIHKVTSLWGGVDIFFVISGFVITSLFLRNSENSDFNQFAIPFWIRRIFRIWPSAIFWICFVFITSIVFNKSGAYGQPIGNFYDLISSLVQVSNFHLNYCTQQGSEAVMGICGVNNNYWSLSLEEQFYLVFPILFFFLNRNSLKWALIMMVAVLFFMTRRPHSFLWWTRTDALAWGCLIALFTSSHAYKYLEPIFLSAKWKALLITALLIILICSFGTNMVIPFQTGIIALLSAFLVWIASYDKGYIFPRGRIYQGLLWIGSRSYALYLTHLFSYFTTREIFFRLYPNKVFNDHFLIAFLVAGVGMSFILADLNYRLLEMPLRRKGMRKAEAMAVSIRSHVVGNKKAEAVTESSPVAEQEDLIYNPSVNL